MPDVAGAERKVSMFEQHFQEALMLVLVALCGWMAWSVNDSSVRIATLTERVAAMQTQIADASSNRYTSVDAARDAAVLNQRVSDLSFRLRDLETRKGK